MVDNAWVGLQRIGSPEDLADLLTSGVADLRTETVEFEADRWATATEQERVELSTFLTEAISAVCAAGLLPPPVEALPPVGSRVESMVVGGKPGPPSKYGTGVVEGLSWDPFFGTWRVHVVYDEPAGTYYGKPIKGSETSAWMVHVIGSAEPPFSSMSPEEIEELYQRRLRQFRP